MKSSNNRMKQRGYALVIVVLIVALVALASATLLDLVTIDFSILGHQRKTMEARTLADGATIEVLDDVQLARCLPDPSAPNMPRVVHAPSGTAPPFRNNCDGSTTDLTEANSGFASNVTTQDKQAYSANVQLLRAGAPRADTSLELAQAVVYEVTTVSSVRNGEATSQVQAQFFDVRAKQQGLIQRMQLTR